MRKMLIVKNIVLKNRTAKRICMYTKFSSHCQLSIQPVLNIQLKGQLNIFYSTVL